MENSTGSPMPQYNFQSSKTISCEQGKTLRTVDIYTFSQNTSKTQVKTKVVLKTVWAPAPSTEKLHRADAINTHTVNLATSPVITLPCKAIQVLPQTHTRLLRFTSKCMKRILVWQKKMAEWMAYTLERLDKLSSQCCMTTILLCDQMWLCPLTMHLVMAHACSTHTHAHTRQKPSQRGMFIDSNVQPAVNGPGWMGFKRTNNLLLWIWVCT